MRILAIRGRNLASLADDFEVDFQSEPLASAGVFAITGPTGAGKSTLLDALSLALFHDTPRLRDAREQGVEIPDAGDSSISPQDPRNILRRGTGEGFAEVDYVGIDNQRWRARWEVRRARQKPDGKLQKPSASLENLDQQQQHGGKIRETREIIERTTGLSYEQFCRSILLAQNEFATFLRASGKDRAELLEALTGTEIYRVISKLCHERTAEEKKKVEILETKLGMDPPLSQQARNDLEEQLAEAERQRSNLKIRHDQIHAEATWREQGRTLQERQEHLQAELTGSERELARRDEETSLVRRMEAIEPARALHRDLEQASAVLTRHVRREPDLESNRKQAEADWKAADKRAAEARQRLEVTEKAQKDQAPKIRKARDIDQQLANLEARLAELQDRTRQSDDQISQAHERLTEGREASRANQATLESWQTWKEAHSQFNPALDCWLDAGQALETADRVLEKRKSAESALQQSQKDADAAASRITLLESRLASARQAVKAARKQRSEAEKQEGKFDAEATEREKEQIDARHRLLEQLETRLAEEAKARQALESAQETLNKLGSDQAKRHERLQELTHAVPAAAEAWTQAQKAWQASSAIADQHTAVLRRDLVEGDPCPVCGSREHPGHDQDNAEIARLVEELAQQLEQAKRVHQNLEREQTVLEAEFHQVDRQQQTQAEEVEQLTAQHEQVRALLQEAAQGLDLGSDDPAKLSEQAYKRLTELETARESLRQRRTALVEARKTLELSRQALTKAEQEAESVESELEAARKSSAPMLETHRSAEAEAKIQREAEREAIETLVRMLDLKQTPDGAMISNLVGQWQAGEKHRAAAEKAAERQPFLQKQLEDLEQQLSALQEEKQKSGKAAESLQKEIGSQRKERQKCVAASNLDVLESELNQTIQDARTDLAEADQARETARSNLVSAETALHHWQQELQAHREAENQARSALTKWLANHHEDEHVALAQDDLETLLELLATPVDQWQPLRKEIARLEQTIHDHRTKLAGLAEQIEAWQTRALSERDEAATRKALEEAVTKLNDAVEKEAMLKAEVHNDDERQERAAGQLEKIRLQQEVCERWQKLDELIGASDGSRFRDYAQQFTLDVLITHANAQLKTLAPRYRLQRGEDNLNILVVDDDMGGEIRGVHSLSGGETFLASLALALGLAELSSQRVRLESLFIDEGFGSLDADTLRVAMDALDRLQAQGRKVGVISHVQEMSDRIGTKIEVERTAPGRSEILIFA